VCLCSNSYHVVEVHGRTLLRTSLFHLFNVTRKNAKVIWLLQLSSSLIYQHKSGLKLLQEQLTARFVQHQAKTSRNKINIHTAKELPFTTFFVSSHKVPLRLLDHLSCRCTVPDYHPFFPRLGVHY